MQRVERTVVGFLHRNRVSILQATLGLVFLWFGALKLTLTTPVAELVTTTIPFIPETLLLVLLGLWEVGIGVLLLWGRFVRTMLVLFLAQMLGTFSVILLQPQVAFQGNNPLLLSIEGEFVIKNLVLVAAGLSVGGQLLQKELEKQEMLEGERKQGASEQPDRTQ